MNIRAFSILLLSFCIVLTVEGQRKNKSKSGNEQSALNTASSYQSKVAAMTKHEGFFNFYHDTKKDKIFLEISRFDEEFLYVNSLPAGVGSNDIGLDRGQLGRSRIVKFQRAGQKVLMVQPNYSYRAISNNQDEVNAVEQAFAQSVLAGFKVDDEADGKVLIDLTSFLLRDAHNVVGRLRGRRQGNYSLDVNRSALYLDRTKAFPDNSEFEATLTFKGNPTGAWIRSVTPSPEAVTVRQHHSFVRLPDNNYEPRAFDPRAGYNGISYLDYATPISENIRKRFIARHRLEKKDPNAARSEAVEPIVYYLDRGAPEPIRSALLDGARWWNQAFETAGYINAFQVEMLPEDADPMDVRYNLIQWVHRSTRGWSYGSSVRDPRTGEIIKGHVTLGSLRVRQDFLIAEGLLAPYEDGTTVPPDMEAMALARLRQLSAHEVGHTIGLSHNFASSMNNRASVMDYPHPLVNLTADGKIDLSSAYDDKIGDWDKVAIAYGYQDFPNGTNEAEALNKILTDAFNGGLRFISDQDARPIGGAHPSAHLWDNGNNAAAELTRVLGVRSAAIKNFSEKNIRTGEPMAMLEEVLVPIYFFHRYQLEGTVKLIGGLNYNYALRGGVLKPTEMVDPNLQRQALESMLSALKPDVLAIPENVISSIPPRPLAYNRGRENFRVRTGLTFDPVGAAETAANMTVSLILHPARAARLVEYHARDNKYPGLQEVVDEMINASWKNNKTIGYYGELEMVVDNVILQNLMKLAANENAASQVRSIAYYKIDQLKSWLQAQRSVNGRTNAHWSYAIAQIQDFQKNPNEEVEINPLSPPAGSPIGSDLELCSWQDY